ncbi:MAG TPA: hypothetical protein VHU81_05940 [Thermoanaerobaculia bacterium]|jgi:hypothetical protein|nr:hypothetical protein [Thermoanaerobaculia bacterium]
MKKKRRKKLTLQRETVVTLESPALRKAVAGQVASEVGHEDLPGWECLSYDVCVESRPSLCIICYISNQSL